MSSFVGRYLCIMLQSESDIIQPAQQAVAGEVVNLKGGREAVLVVHATLLEINLDVIVRLFMSAANKLCHFFVIQDDGEHAVFHAVVGKDVRK